MKINKLFQLGLCATALMVSCVAEKTEAPQVIDGETVVAAIENYGTRTSVNEDLQVLWDTGDCISVFRQSTLNKQYQLKGEGGTAKGTFAYVSGVGYGSTIDKTYGVYPYDEAVRLGSDEVLSLTLPAEQAYVENGFGPGANVMVAVSEDNKLSFKNLCGYLGFKFCGDAAVKKITLRGNAGEVLAGPVEVTVAPDADPEMTFAEKADAEEIVLTCDPPVQLTMEDTTLFWVVVPPVEFAEGFTVTVEYEGVDGEGTLEQVTEKVQTVERNVLNTMAAVCIKTQKELTIKRLWGKYPTEWPTFSQNLDRCATMDEEYIYVAQQGNGKKGVWAIPLDGDLSKAKEVNMTGVESAGTHYTSCVRTIFNPNTGKHILLLCNLALNGGDHLYLYAYENGIDAAPTKLLYDYTLPTWAERRFGDFFTVVGDWNKGHVWFRTNTTGASTTARWNIVDGKLTNQTPDGFNYGYGASQGKGSFYQYDMSAKTGLLITNNIGMFYDLNSAEGIAWNNNIGNEAMKNLFGFTPFEFNGEKYIAFLKLYNAARSWVTIIKDSGDFKTDLETFTKTGDNIVYQAAVQIEEDGPSTNVVSGATYSDQTSANCTAIVKEDGVYIMAQHHNVGLSLFKMSME